MGDVGVGSAALVLPGLLWLGGPTHHLPLLLLDLLLLDLLLLDLLLLRALVLVVVAAAVAVATVSFCKAAAAPPAVSHPCAPVGPPAELDSLEQRPRGGEPRRHNRQLELVEECNSLRRPSQVHPYWHSDVVLEKIRYPLQLDWHAPSRDLKVLEVHREPSHHVPLQLALVDGGRHRPAPRQEPRVLEQATATHRRHVRLREHGDVTLAEVPPRRLLAPVQRAVLDRRSPARLERLLKRVRTCVGLIRRRRRRGSLTPALSNCVQKADRRRAVQPNVKRVGRKLKRPLEPLHKLEVDRRRAVGAGYRVERP
jgi:hypothetical protein